MRNQLDLRTEAEIYKNFGSLNELFHTYPELNQYRKEVRELLIEDIERSKREYYVFSQEEIEELGRKAKKAIIEKGEHYKHKSKAEITLYGNSCIIKEDLFSFNDLQKFEASITNLMRLPKPSPFIEDHINFEQKFKETGLLFLKRVRRIESKPPTRKSKDITTFSKKSRLNMLKKLNKVDFKNGKTPYFITLTYPGRYPKEREKYKRDLDVFLKRFKREFGEMAYMWRLEAQKRGAPHYHLIVYTKKKSVLEHMKKWVSRNWFEVVQRTWEVKMEEHLHAGTNVKMVDNIRMATVYVSKYMSKEQNDLLKAQGRYWGTSQNWGDLIIENFELTSTQTIAFRRLLKNYLRVDNRFMARRVVRTQNIEIWGSYTFMMNALKWVVVNY